MILENALIEQARSGGEGLEKLIAAVWPEAYKIAYSILRDSGLAEDAAQDACAAMARSLATLKDSSAFHAWSYKIIVNHAITAARRRPQTQALDTATDRGVRFDQSDAMDLYNAMAMLTHVQRSIILLHYYAGLKSGEIASAIGFAAPTVRFHLVMARRALRKALATTESTTQPPSKEVLSDVQ